MTRLSDTFAQLKEDNEGALIAYVTAGDPHPKKTPHLIGALIEGGADIIELGIPFSDPMADGPTIQRAALRSITSGARPLDTFNIARTVHERYDQPLVVMSYFNPIFRVGIPKFLSLAKQSGISGIIVPDLPVEESKDYREECVAAEIDTIFLASPSTNQERLEKILNQTSGYLYLVPLYGITGVRERVAESTLTIVKKYSNIVAGSIPLAVGFGISTPHHIRQIIRAGADGAIVGSAFVNVIEKNSRNMPRASKKLESFARAMKKATRTVK